MKLEEMEKRLKNLEDIESIRQLQIRYVNDLTTIDWDDLLDCFTEDAVVDLSVGVVKGKQAIEDLFKNKIAITHVGQEGNYVVHPIITVEGDKATGSWLLYTHFSLPHKIQIDPSPVANVDAPDWMGGYYEMEYVREKGDWKISLLRWTRSLYSPRPPDEQ
ncbi:MAG: nuclear transport factor 2 family protein [Dehalococcoidales bacterium]|nr:nuclear transport factor 2 family protein [Dehalococcoidales bacterium]